MEVCVDSVASAVYAENGGAIRVELCSNLMEGGTTPSAGMLQTIKTRIHIPVFCMVRPRGGDFMYTADELEVMERDIQVLKANGADGIVLGILKSDGSVDKERCHKLIDAARPLPITFHRAIDMCHDIEQSLEDVISLGCERVLTSGGDFSVLEGLPVIEKMIQQANGRILIVPGGGINERNLERILERTGSKEFHGTARSSVSSRMEYQKTGVTMGASLSPSEFSNKVTDMDKVRKLVAISEVLR